jgi:predicted RNA-binding Zn-ribbon protein involved in translation (DUF1610 family)
MSPKNHFAIKEVLIKFACANCGTHNVVSFRTACRKARRCIVCKFRHEIGIDFKMMEDSWPEIAQREIDRIGTMGQSALSPRTIKPAAGKSKISAKRAQRAAR